ncbi:chromosome segregation protein SMC [Stappia sp. 22II-S9-Z10]|nr:chromosome segregation protein SMC [Stappia sp. 22II-S9-Z10]
MKFDRLRLIGFKSFVEPTDVLIEPGLTGVVGPNGCGKSNLVEALRWVMGEASYKSVRGSSMDDVIFAGSGRRPTRDTAEVTLFLDNSARTAPADLNTADRLEVTRRINRGVGSDYRVNGKLVRARDVQLLFADAATGSRSPSMVRQGQVAELIAAKPTDRRNILEEAAGISGLRARKHEASLKLNAAEQNLTRIEDVAGEVERRIENLRRQAKQAQRYRKISEEIRTLEATVHHLRWSEAKTAVTSGETAMAETAAALKAAAERQVRTATEEAAASHALPALREAENAAAAKLQSLAAALAALDAKDREISGKLASLQSQAQALTADLARQDRAKTDAAAALARLEDEDADLRRSNDGADERIAAREYAAEEADAAAEEADAAASAATEAAATALAARAALDQAHLRAAAEVAKARETVRRLDAELEKARTSEAVRRRDEAAATVAIAEDAEAEAAAGEAEAAETVAAAEEAEAEAGHAEADAAATVAETEAAMAPARAAEAAARQALAAVDAEISGLQTEASALERLTASLGRADDAVLDSCTVEPGYEIAFAAALGDDLEAPISADAPARWAAEPPVGADPVLPSGAAPLAAHVKAPAALARRLAQVGLVEDGALAGALQPGQRLVTRDGALWRWDGYARAAGAPSAAAERLAQKNRLAEIGRAIDALAPAREDAEAAIAAAEEGVAAAAEEDRTARALLAATRQGVADARKALAAARATQTTARGLLATERKAVAAAKERLAAAETAAREAEAAESRIAATLEAAHATAESAEEALAEAEAARDGASDGHAESVARDRAKAAAADARRAATEAANAAEQERRAVYGRSKRLERLAGELNEWRDRLNGADAHKADLEQRLEAIAEEQEALADAPSDTAEERFETTRAVKTAEAANAAAREARATGEAAERAATQAARDALAALSAAREAAGRAEERTAAARSRLAEVESALIEALDVAPAAAMKLAGLAPGDPLPDRPESEKRLERLKGERERLGGVNLVAEDELKEIEERQGTMLAERDDIVAAIDKLRTAIKELNGEARQRLVASFDHVNGEFQRLFTKLFNGGEARLVLTEAEDPLDAGLDIIARPPGKKPQVLSLLSGGEQTLTATALIFAVFLTNPAPICVLDEIDAPLDDANVERFCNLLDEMARATETRFITITHNPITMARMHRLYGVTMVEKGVSQLVSVSLEAAEELRETA